jgi:hypothetical protein
VQSQSIAAGASAYRRAGIIVDLVGVEIFVIQVSSLASCSNRKARSVLEKSETGYSDWVWFAQSRWEVAEYVVMSIPEKDRNSFARCA